MAEKNFNISCGGKTTKLQIRLAPCDEHRIKTIQVPFELVAYKGGFFKIRSEEGKYGIADSDGKVVVEPVWTDVEILGEDGSAQAFAAKENIEEFLFEDGEADIRLFTTEGEAVSDIIGVKWIGANEGIAVAYQRKAEWGPSFWMMGGVRCIDLKTKTQLFCHLDDYFKEYSWREVFHDGLLRVPCQTAEGYEAVHSTFLNRKGEEVHSYVEAAKHSSEGMIVGKGTKLFGANKYGAFDSRGSSGSIKPKYDEMESYHNGYAVAMKKGKYGFVDKQGKVTAELEWDSLSDLWEDGLALARKGEEHMLIDHTGTVKMALKCSAEQYLGYAEGVYLLSRNGKGGPCILIDEGGNRCYFYEIDGFEIDCRGMHRGLIPIEYGSCMDAGSVWNVYDCGGSAILDTDASFRPADTGLGFSSHCIYDYGWKQPAHRRRRLPAFFRQDDSLFRGNFYECTRRFGTAFEPFRLSGWLSGDAEIAAKRLKDYFESLAQNGLKDGKPYLLDSDGSALVFFEAADREGLSALQVTIDEETVVNCDFMAVVVRDGEEARFRFAAAREFIFH